MDRKNLIAAVFAQAVAAGKTVPEAAALAEGVNAIPDALLAIVGPAMLATTPAPTATSAQDASASAVLTAPHAPSGARPLSVSGTPLTDKQLEARLVRLDMLEQREQERRAKAAKKCPIQPAVFLTQGPEITAAAFRGVSIEPRGFKFAVETGPEGKAVKIPGTAKSCGYWGQFKARVTLTLPGGASQEIPLNGQATCTVIGSKDWTQEQRNTWITQAEKGVIESLDLAEIVGQGLEQGTDREGDTLVQDSAKPREFDGGSVGYYLGGKVTLDDGTKLQVGINVTVPGSKAVATGA